MFRYLILVLAAGGCAGGAQPALEVYTAPEEERLSGDYDLTVNGRKVPVYVCRVPAIPFNGIWLGQQRPLDQTELAAFAYWDMSGPVEVEVVSGRPVATVAVRPTARGIRPHVVGNRITFRLPSPGPVTVEVNGRHGSLHLFASPSRPAAYEEGLARLPRLAPKAPTTAPASAGEPVAGGPGVVYFGPGVHRPGRMVLESNQIIYIAGGAVVRGSIQATNASNIKVLGRGILDAGDFERGRGVAGCIRLTNCRNVTIDGVILRDPAGWCLTVQTCSNVNITNVKEIGLWKQNSDGMDICNSEDVTIRDCFIRSFDDSIVVKGMRGRSGGEPRNVRRVLAERCVIWNDWGRALEIGAETSCAEMTDITFRDCDIIHTDFAAMDIQHGDKAAIRNILYDNVRFEIDDVNYEPILWHAAGETYKPQPNWCPRMLIIEIVKTEWNRDANRGTVDNVTLRNVSVTGKKSPPSRIQGLDPEHPVKGVLFENLRFNGRVIRRLEDSNVEVRPFVQDVRFQAP